MLNEQSCTIIPKPFLPDLERAFRTSFGIGYLRNPNIRSNSLHISANLKPQVILLSFKKLPLVENKGVEGLHMNDLWVRVDFVKAAFKGIEW